MSVSAVVTQYGCTLRHSYHLGPMSPIATLTTPHTSRAFTGYAGHTARHVCNVQHALYPSCNVPTPVTEAFEVHFNLDPWSVNPCCAPCSQTAQVHMTHESQL